MTISVMRQLTDLETQIVYVLTMPDYTRAALLDCITKMKPSVKQIEYEAEEYELDLTATGTGLG